MTQPVPEDKLRLGGMALRNGLLVHGPTHWAAAVRDRRRARSRSPRGASRGSAAGATERVPGLRGVAKLGEAMAVIPLVKRALPEAKLPMQDVRTLGAMGGAALGGQAHPLGRARAPSGREAAVGAGQPGARAARAARRRPGRLPRRRAQGDRRLRGTTATPPTPTKEHDRCGSNLVAPMLAAAARRATWRRAGPACAGPAAEAAVGAGQRGRGGRGVRLVRAPLGHRRWRGCCASPGTRSSAWWARASRPPSSSRWARAALAEILRVEADGRRQPEPHGHRAPTASALDPAVFRLPVERIREGYYTDAYFNFTKELLEDEGRHPRVTMQVFQKHESVLGGIDEAIAVLKLCAGRHRRTAGEPGWDELAVHALHEGDEIEPYETVMTIEGDYSLFAHLETVYLGCLARRTLVMRNVREVVEAADGKPILFFPARHDHWLVQTGDGWAAHVAGAIGVSTDAQASWWGGRGVGTVPHGLIAAYGGDTVAAARGLRRALRATR